MTWITLLLSAIALAGLFLAQFRIPVPQIGGEYVEGVVGNPRLINPIFASANETDLGLTRLLYSGLVRFNGKQEIVTDLAENYTVSEDKKIYTFNLVSNAHWHDAKSVTARDVAFTFALLEDPTLASPLAGTFAGIKVETVSEYTVRFTLPEVYPAFLSALTVGILPEHIWSIIPRDQIRLAEMNLKPIGSGPFQFKRLIREETGFISRYELSRNAEYYRQPPYIKDMVWQFYSEYEGDNGMLEALRTKKVSGLNFIPTALKEKTAVKHVRLATLQLPQYTALFFNLNNEGILSDKTMRQALSLAINKPKILQETLDNEGAAIDSPVLFGFPGYKNPLLQLGLPEEANEFLDKKWSRISAEDYRQKLITEYVEEHSSTSTASTDTTSTLAISGATEIEKTLSPAQLFYRINKNKTMAILNLVTADTPEYREAAALIAGYWQDIGVKTNITYVSQKEIAQSILKDRDYDVLLYGVIVGSDPDQFPFWHSSQVKYPGLNLSGYTNKKVDEILLKIRQTSDSQQLNDLYLEFQKLLAEDVPAIFLYSPTYVYVLGNQIYGFAVERIAHPADRFANVTDWYIKIGSEWKFKK
ncbi:MAG: hypothetical protein A2821_04525 [Candidatus Magasanikbacteria bacterium RIFCSPHIGHO2_01_FULL_41_23]|uniref:Solute-binding protein family 5 domain-containing protein n=1 Tax=Candidatus Magasanikbacteria bacterium RIFCSPLOWO2_01_FULL_40_15 TaxID=1798686 RepID=A0A1F6N401_9BACT|nr:MAG: hypothetical protein A2821_04525 [Candidatus Magasanikbacteria bacterium RIFCSPHIGHO2_01_FULL_41_23]OGH67189.1 MAG: hypothetical protein A3C66_02840 [Candidatus Magasanikbacteria bacterium RIFCSPHIGHO2_02_FULL_41_35]OGH75446.1 MAG: hypothetical protein A3F22_01305 [Candidatus Magasanikbacteria bacterium RIFCSPHIGHO2_12_FULL_41_16]OGH78725.1 MAG: hypothetical protein A2983_04480 [Candidatus Magasanikbacteria bacterium RIFCSPLOWO2_01_FULL_40_15]